MEKSDKNEWLIWRLTDLSYQNPDDIESNEIEIMGEDAEGRDAYCTVKINEMAGDAVIRIRALESQIAGQWISVEDELPDIGTDVLIRIPVCSHFNVESGSYKGEGQFVGAWFVRRGKGCTYDVTHWMSIPTPPTGD